MARSRMRLRLRLSRPASERRQGSIGSCPFENRYKARAGTGFDAVFGTLSLTQKLSEASATSGTCTWTGQSFQKDGTTLGTLGDGTWEQLPGESKWKIVLNGEISNGDRLRTEGVIDLPARLYTGSIFPA